MDKKSLLIIIVYCGGFLEVLENMLVVFRMVKENGVDGVEFDVDFMKDGKVVVIYDFIVDRMINGKGLVSDYNFEEFR